MQHRRGSILHINASHPINTSYTDLIQNTHTDLLVIAHANFRQLVWRYLMSDAAQISIGRHEQARAKKQTAVNV